MDRNKFFWERDFNFVRKQPIEEPTVNKSEFTRGSRFTDVDLLIMDEDAAKLYESGIRHYKEIYLKMRRENKLPRHQGQVISSTTFSRRMKHILEQRKIPIRSIWQDVVDAVQVGLTADEIVKKGICQTKDTPHKVAAALGLSRRRITPRFKKLVLDYVQSKTSD